MKINDLPTEQKEQELLVRWLQLQYPHVLFCASAGGLRTTTRMAINMKRAGYRKGFPDLFIYEPRNGCAGLAIELKRSKGGQVSEHQHKWIEDLKKRGYSAYICYGFDEAKAIIEKYLE